LWDLHWVVGTQSKNRYALLSGQSLLILLGGDQP
jgi:hypothetical protein